jgi:hypothetical protein
MQAQHRRGELMQLKDPPNPAMIKSDLVTGLDNPRQFSGGEGVREGEPHDLMLHMERDAHVDRGRAACMGQGPVIQKADKTRALKALQIPP